jgi:hypothetical protein
MAIVAAVAGFVECIIGGEAFEMDVSFAIVARTRLYSNHRMSCYHS